MPFLCAILSRYKVVYKEIIDKYLETFHIVEDCIDETIILKTD